MKQRRVATCMGVQTAFHRIIAAIKYHSGGIQMASHFFEDPSDEELVQRIQFGDLATFNVLHQRYQGQLYHRVRAIVGPEDAWDITQETLWKAFQKLSTSGSLISNFRSWIFTVAKNASIDHLRKQGREPPKELDDNEMTQQSPEAAFIWKEQFQEAIEMLNSREREILSLSTQGYTTKEIAQQLQLGHHSVSTYLSSARKKLHEIFSKKKIQCERNGEIRIQIIKATPEIC